MKPVLASGLLAASLLGCAATAPQLQTEHSYQVEWIGERPLIDRSHLTITFGDDGRAYGNAGCNHWFAGYQLDGDKLGFSAAGSTRKMCAEALMEQEARFLESLGQVQRWDFNDIGQLQLWPAAGKPIRLWPEGS
ncbi:META domain-containing protein [Pseudomonas sp. EA_105y_Pfl2_R69]|jgi:heat shock protein HslJ|uniref:META domain-containing protein n=1 Tax=Pseudomonas sp. EA_105y_Pfl2_R69 TaxID=3088683 RepID=UPI0030DCC760